MNKVWLSLMPAVLFVSVPASAALGADGAALLSRFMEAVRADPELLQAARQTQSGEAAAAIPKLVAYTRANPRSAEAWYLLGMAYVQNGQQDLSNQAAMRAASMKPELNELTRHLQASGAMAGSDNAPATQRAVNKPKPTPGPQAPRARSGAPAQLTGRWQCMRSVVTDYSAYQTMLTFTLTPGSWTDLTFGPARASKRKATYADGDLKLYDRKGDLLHTLRWTPAGDGGTSERLVEVLGPKDTARAGEVCYPASASAASVKEKPDSEKTGLRRGGDPFNAFDYPAHVIVACACDEIPVESVVTFRLTPAAGGAPRIYTRTVGQLRTSPLPSFKVPLDETATLVVPAAGRYRVSAELRMPEGRTVPLRMGDELEAELEWTGTYYDGAKYLSVVPVG